MVRLQREGFYSNLRNGPPNEMALDERSVIIKSKNDKDGKLKRWKVTPPPFLQVVEENAVPPTLIPPTLSIPKPPPMVVEDHPVESTNIFEADLVTTPPRKKERKKEKKKRKDEKEKEKKKKSDRHDDQPDREKRHKKKKSKKSSKSRPESSHRETSNISQRAHDSISMSPMHSCIDEVEKTVQDTYEQISNPFKFFPGFITSHSYNTLFTCPPLENIRDRQRQALDRLKKIVSEQVVVFSPIIKYDYNEQYPLIDGLPVLDKRNEWKERDLKEIICHWPDKTMQQVLHITHQNYLFAQNQLPCPVLEETYEKYKRLLETIFDSD